MKKMDNFYFPMAVKLPATNTTKNNSGRKKKNILRHVSPRVPMDSADRFISLPPAPVSGRERLA